MMSQQNILWPSVFTASLLIGYSPVSFGQDATVVPITPVTTTAAPAAPVAAPVAPSYISNDEYAPDLLRARLSNINGQIELTYNELVRNHIIYYTLRKREVAQLILGRKKVYEPIFDKYLRQYNLPPELRNLSIIESALNPFAVSPAGAGGLWQFMPGTAPMWGLKIDKNVDERFDPEKETEAACKFLSFLYQRYGNWQLAIAAYNCGPGRVDAAIAQSGGISDFWTVYDHLPNETRNYVPAFIAATYMTNYYSLHGIEPATVDSKLTNTETIMVLNGTSLRQVCQASGVSPAVITYLNPSFRRGVIPASAQGYRLVLPLENYVAYQNYLANPQSAPINNMQNYDDINIAPREEAAPVLENVSESMPLNASPHSRRSTALRERTERVSQKTADHVIKRGESLSVIAQKHGMTLDELRKLNGIKKGSKGDLDPGEKLIIKKGKH